MKSKPKTILLLLMPCLLLASLGYIFQAYTAGKKFAFTTSTISPAPLGPLERRLGDDTKFVLVVNTKGDLPKWISEPRLKPQDPSPGSSTSVRIFYKRNGKDIEFKWPKGVRRGSVRTFRINEETGQFIYECSINLGVVPKKLGPLTCEIEGNLLYVTKVPRLLAIPYTSAKNTIVVRR